MRFCLVLAVCLSLTAPVTARIIHADDDAAGGSDGPSWQDAYRYLQDALAIAQKGSTITNGGAVRRALPMIDELTMVLAGHSGVSTTHGFWLAARRDIVDRVHQTASSWRALGARQIRAVGS